MYKHTQRSFAGGRLDRELMGRQDLAKYFTGASEITNMLVRRQGNLAKRRGTDFAADLTGILGNKMECGFDYGQVELGAHRLLPLVGEREQGYYVLLAGRRAFLLDSSRGIFCSDGVWRRSVAPYPVPQDGEASATDADFSFVTPYAARIGVTYYDSLQDAATAMSPGDTIDVGEDVVLSAAITVKGTINLHGHAVTFGSAAAKITFSAGAGVACGIVSGGDGGTRETAVEVGARIAWDGGVSATSSMTAVVHSSGVMTLRDVEIDCPSTHSSACAVSSTSTNADDLVFIVRCSIAARGGYGVLHLSGTNANASTWNGTADCYVAGVKFEDCDLSYAYGQTASSSYFAVRHAAASSANARRVVFASGRLRAPNHPASNLGLFVYGGILDCSELGTVTNAAYPVSTMRRGLCTADLAAGFVESGTVAANDGADKVRVAFDGLSLVSYARTADYRDGDQATPAYTPDMATVSFPYTVDRAAESSRTPSEASTASLTYGSAPYCVSTSYSDAELDDLDAFQSGDTIFLAHRMHAPAKIVFDPDALTLAFSRLSFNASRWKRPVLLSAADNVHIGQNTLQYSGNTETLTEVVYAGRSKTTTVKVNGTAKASTSTTLPARTVTYCVTYVKDGSESPPSNPLSVTYGAPWEEGGTVKLSFSRGANAEEPDYYNVYKKETTGFGLIGRTSRAVDVGRTPSAYGWDADGNVLYSPGLLPSATVDGAAYGATEREDVLGETPQDAFDGTAAAAAGGFTPRAGCGGMRFGPSASALFEFGQESRIVADAVVLSLDAHTLAYESVDDEGDPDFGRVRVYDDMLLSGATVTVEVTHQPMSGARRALAVATATAELGPVETGGGYQPVGARRRYCGTVDRSAGRADVAAAASLPLRTATLSFPALAGGDRQIVRVVVTCRDGNGDVCECVLSGFALRSAQAADTTYTDNYITPDMSLTPPSDETAFSSRGDFPSCVGMYQQRLVFAATADRPFAFWMSAVGDLYTFAAHDSVREDDAISAELAATEFPRINHLVFNRDLVLLADGGEWRIAPTTGNTLTYKTLSATLQSQIGSAKWLKPLTVGNEVIFAERTGRALRSIVYNYASDGYESQDLTVLAGNIFAGNAIRRMCYKQHPDSTIVCVLADGTLAAMVYMPEHEVAAWTRHVLGGGARAAECATSKALNGGTTDVALVVRRGEGKTELWAVRPDDPAMTVGAQCCMDGVRALSGAEAVGQWQDGWVAVDALTADVHESADGIDGGRAYLCGFPFGAELVTVRPEVQSQGTVQFEVKNAKDAEVRVLDSASWRAAPVGYADDPVYAQRVDAAPAAEDGALALDSSDRTLILSGHNTGDGRVQLKSDDPWPLNILSLSVNYEIQPLSNSEG